MEHDERAGAVEDFLNMEILGNWYESDSESRRWYITGDKDDLYPPFKFDNINLMKRDKACGIEIWIECFGKELGDYDKKAMNGMAMIMSQIPGWEKADGKVTINPYGR